jgi:hypothetical protein
MLRGQNIQRIEVVAPKEEEVADVTPSNWPIAWLVSKKHSHTPPHTL